MKNIKIKLKNGIGRLCVQTTKYKIMEIEAMDIVGRWIVGIAGVTMAGIFAFVASVYTSFLQTFDKCQIRMMASDTILVLRSYILTDFLGAACILAGMALPHFAKLSWLARHTRESGKQPVSGPDAEEWRPTKLVAEAHFFLVSAGAILVAAVLLTAWSTMGRQTYGGLTSYIQEIDAKCKALIAV